MFYIIQFIISAKLVPLAYGIHKLQISCVVEDEKVSIDWLQETLQEIEDFVRNMLKVLCNINYDLVKMDLIPHHIVYSSYY